MSDERVQSDALDYAAFARRATDERLSKYQKIGFPDSYRTGFEQDIFADIRAKLTRLDERGLNVIDIGPGCSDLPLMMIEHCRLHGHRLRLIDSREMLAQLPDEPFIEKLAGAFPKCRAGLTDLIGKADVIVSYSVLHHAILNESPFDFVDFGIQLLAPEGAFLIGDIPNDSKRMRFFSSDAGIAFHRRFTGTNADPGAEVSEPRPGNIDDAVVLRLLARARAAGVDAYVLPQPSTLPMHNRREDILLRKP
jgi:hypothetical protein